jgi:hypothetical protein
MPFVVMEEMDLKMKKEWRIFKIWMPLMMRTTTMMRKRVSFNLELRRLGLI